MGWSEAQANDAMQGISEFDFGRSRMLQPPEIFEIERSDPMRTDRSIWLGPPNPTETGPASA